MVSIVRSFLIALPFVSAGCAPPAGSEAEGSAGSTSSADALECVAAMHPDISIIMSPAPVDGPFVETCTVTDVTDDEPLRLAMTCPDGSGALDWSLEVSSLPVSLSASFVVGQLVDLYYLSNDGPSNFHPRLTQSAVLRNPGDDAPLFIAATVESPSAIAGGLGSLTVDFVAATNCEAQPGTCGFGIMRRAAFEFSLEGEDSTIVFDHNDGSIGAYHIRVGEAFVDEGNCEGVSENWYELVIVRANE